MRNLLTLFLAIIAIIVYGQTFEGKITYQNSYKSKLPNVQDQQFNSMMGTVQEYIIKEGNYKSSFNGTLIKWQLYINKDNKLYNKIANSETILWNVGNINPDSVISVEINKGVVDILGYKCDEVKMNCKSGVQKYYFNQKIGVDIALFKNHFYGNWYEYLNVSQSLPLKSIIDTQQFNLVSEAISLQEMKLDAKEFQLPENAKTAKSPY
ncbi:MAG: hypothetical protein IPK35_01765 [Saprospiraceae bacterium]|jgi:hypothetical protein|nr:hypothetical protein [Saprospiraceae bacterium]